MVRIKSEIRKNKSLSWMYFSPVAALLLSIFFGILVFYFLGYPVAKSFYAFFIKPFTSFYSLGELAIKSTPLILIALGLSIGFRAGVWNIGGEGQYILGSIGASAVTLYFFDVSGFWLLPLILIVAMLSGLLWAAIPAFLKDKLNVNEILSSLMLNYIGFLLLTYLVHGIFKDPAGFNFPESKIFHDAAMLPILAEGTRLHLGVLVTIFFIFVVWIVLQKTLIGFQIKVIGFSTNAALFAGFSQRKLLWISLLFGGALAGLAGMMEVNGSVGQITTTFATGYGYTAIIVAFLGRLHPVGIFFAGILMAVSFIGGEIAQIELGFPKAVTGLFQGMVLFFLLACDYFNNYKVTILKNKKWIQ